jgi:beta-N-acetylglucosaminidase
MLNYDEDTLDCDEDTEMILSQEAKKSTVVSFNTKSDYTKDYVKALEQELHKLMKENLYLKSDEYINRALAERQIPAMERKNELMTKKINFLTLLVRELSHNSVDREDILNTLKAILDGDFSEFKQSTTNKDNDLPNSNIHQLAQYISLKYNLNNTKNPQIIS